MTIKDLSKIYHGEVEIVEDWNILKFDEGGCPDVPESLLNAEIKLIDPCCAASDYTWLRIYI